MTPAKAPLCFPQQDRDEEAQGTVKEAPKENWKKKTSPRGRRLRLKKAAHPEKPGSTSAGASRESVTSPLPSLLAITAVLVTRFFIGKFSLKSEAYRELFLLFPFDENALWFFFKPWCNEYFYAFLCTETQPFSWICSCKEIDRAWTVPVFIIF